MANPVATGTAPSVPRTSVRAREPFGPLLRLRTRLRRSHLDADIARGDGRPEDPALALRKTQLVDGRQRRRLAKRLEEFAEEPARRSKSSSRVPIDREAVAIANPVLTDLAALLRSPHPVEARGMALGWLLLTDPGSPLYESDDGGSAPGARLVRESRLVLEALRPV
jgi:hypothetical protein